MVFVIFSESYSISDRRSKQKIAFYCCALVSNAIQFNPNPSVKSPRSSFSHHRRLSFSNFRRNSRAGLDLNREGSVYVISDSDKAYPLFMVQFSRRERRASFFRN